MITAQEEKGFSRRALWEPGPGGTVLRADRVRSQWAAKMSDQITNATPTPEDAAAREEFVKLENLDPSLPFKKFYFATNFQGFTVIHGIFLIRFWLKDEEVLTIPHETHTGTAQPTEERAAINWNVAATVTPYDSIQWSRQYAGGTNSTVTVPARLLNVTCDRISVKIVSLAGSTYGANPEGRILLACLSTNYTG